MKRLNYLESFNSYNDPLLPYELTKMMHDAGYSQNVYPSSVFINGKQYATNRVDISTLGDDDEILGCITIYEAMRWLNKRHKVYATVKVWPNDFCQPLYEADLTYFPNANDCDQGDPTEYAGIRYNRFWHTDENGYEIVCASETELYLDIISYELGGSNYYIIGR